MLRRWAAALLVLAGCLGPAQASFELLLPPTGLTPAVPMLLEDQAGLVRRVEAVPEEVPRQLDGVANLAGRPDVLVVSWTTGTCVEAIVMRLEPAPGGHLLSVTTRDRLGGCRLAAIQRALLLQLSKPIDASAVQLHVASRLSNADGRSASAGR